MNCPWVQTTEPGIEVMAMPWSNYVARILRFKAAGVLLPLHKHDADLNHGTVCIKGRVELAREGEPPVILECGEAADIADNQMHSILALTDDARVIQIIKNRT